MSFMPDHRHRPEEFSTRELIELGFWEVLTSIHRQEYREMTDFTAIEQEVADQSSVIDSVSTLLTKIHDELLAAGTDQTALDNLAASIQSNTAKLAAAADANPDPAAAPPADTTPPPAETGTNPDGSPPPEPPTDGTGVADLPPAEQPPEAGTNPDGSAVQTDPNIPEGTAGVTEEFLSAGESSPETGGQITPEQ